MAVSVLEALAHWAAEQPDKAVWSFLDDGCRVVDVFTYRELDRASSSLAAYLLHSCGIDKGERALLVFAPGLHYAVALLACFKAGIVAVPVFPPDPRKLEKDIHHFVSITESSGSKVALTHSAYSFARKVSGLRSFFVKQQRSWPELNWIDVDEVILRAKGKAGSGEGPKLPPAPGLGDVAFLQYTSGSTSEPKGVMVSHGNLAHNESVIIRELRADTSTVNVSWLPQYHDMGLIGSYLGALYCGGSGLYLSPLSFLRDPVVWLRALSLFRGTHTQAPNFAFALATRKFREAQRSNPGYASALALDLSSVRNMLNAAEPVDDVAIGNFYAVFAKYGLARGVVVPTYGLAEHTVFVCGRGRTVLLLRKSFFDKQRVAVEDSYLLGEEGTAGRAEGMHAVVGCGFPSLDNDIELAIADDELRRLGEDEVPPPPPTRPSLTRADRGDLRALAIQGARLLGHGRAIRRAVQRLPRQHRPGGRARRLPPHGRPGLPARGRAIRVRPLQGPDHRARDQPLPAGHREDGGDPRARAAAGLLGRLCAQERGRGHGAGGPRGGGALRRPPCAAVSEGAQVREGVAADAYADIAMRVRQSVSSRHGVAVSSVCLLATRTVPKTTSGKIARAWCRRAFLDGSLEVVHRLDASTEELLGGEEVDVDSPADGETAASAEPLEPRLTQEETRALSESEIAARLSAMLIRISGQSGSALAAPVDPQAPIATLGLDSLVLVQFNGVLQKRSARCCCRLTTHPAARFYCTLPDDFLFSQMACLDQLSKAVRHGGITPAQEAFMAAPPSDEGPRRGAPIAPNSPLCPWFVCCY